MIKRCWEVSQEVGRFEIITLRFVSHVDFLVCANSAFQDVEIMRVPGTPINIFSFFFELSMFSRESRYFGACKHGTRDTNGPGC